MAGARAADHAGDGGATGLGLGRGRGQLHSEEGRVAEVDGAGLAVPDSIWLAIEVALAIGIAKPVVPPVRC